MRRNRTRAGLTAAALAAAVACTMTAQAAPSVQERLDALERKVDSRGLIDLLTQVEQMQRDLQQLRGELEEQQHTIEGLQRAQRDQYVDIDNRLRQLGGGAAVPAGQPAGTLGSLTPEPPPVPVVAPPVNATAAPPAEKQFDFTSPAATGAAPAMAGPGGAPAGDVMYAPGGGSAPAAAATANPADEKAEYDTALAILRDGRYSDAALAFKQIISKHPNGSYTDNAYYWLGETYYVTRDFDQAQSAFRDLMSQYPQSSKVPDGRLKLGFIYYEKQDWKAARTELEAVVNGWPGSTAARLAGERLTRMKQEKH